MSEPDPMTSSSNKPTYPYGPYYELVHVGPLFSILAWTDRRPDDGKGVWLAHLLDHDVMSHADTLEDALRRLAMTIEIDREIHGGTMEKLKPAPDHLWHGPIFDKGFSRALQLVHGMIEGEKFEGGEPPWADGWNAALECLLEKIEALPR